MSLLARTPCSRCRPFAMWLQGAANIGRWMVQPGPSECRGSRCSAHLGQRLPRLRPVPAGSGRRLRALGAQVLEISGGQITGMNFFLSFLDPEAALSRLRAPASPRRLDRPVRGALRSAGETSSRTTAPPRRRASRARRSHVVDRADVRGSRPLEDTGGQLGAVGADDSSRHQSCAASITWWTAAGRRFSSARGATAGTWAGPTCVGADEGPFPTDELATHGHVLVKAD